METEIPYATMYTSLPNQQSESDERGTQGADGTRSVSFDRAGMSRTQKSPQDRTKGEQVSERGGEEAPLLQPLSTETQREDTIRSTSTLSIKERINKTVSMMFGNRKDEPEVKAAAAGIPNNTESTDNASRDHGDAGNQEIVPDERPDEHDRGVHREQEAPPEDASSEDGDEEELSAAESRAQYVAGFREGERRLRRTLDYVQSQKTQLCSDLDELRARELVRSQEVAEMQAQLATTLQKVNELQAQGKEVGEQLLRERRQHAREVQSKQDVLQDAQERVHHAQEKYKSLLDEAQRAVRRENARANELVVAFNSREDEVQGFMRSLKSKIVPGTIGGMPPDDNTGQPLQRESRHSYPAYVTNPAHPEYVLETPDMTKPVGQSDEDDLLKQIILEGRQANDQAGLNSSQGQLSHRIGGIGRSEYVGRGNEAMGLYPTARTPGVGPVPYTTAVAGGNNSTYVVHPPTVNPRAGTMRPRNSGAESRPSRYGYAPGATVEVMDALAVHNDSLDDMSDTSSEAGREATHPKFDPLGRTLPSKTDLKYLSQIYHEKSDRTLRIEQIPEFKDSTKDMYWEQWKAFFLSEAKELKMTEKEKLRHIAGKCKGRAGAVVAKVKLECSQTGVPYTSVHVLSELSDEFFDNSVRVTLEKEVHGGLQKVDRVNPEKSETLYEFCDRMYTLCQRLHSEDWAAADKEWLGCMNRGVVNRRDLEDYIMAPTSAGKRPSQIIKTLRNLGEHKVKEVTVSELLPTSSPAGRQLMASDLDSSRSSLSMKRDDMVECRDGNYFANVEFHPKHLDVRMVEGCAQTMYHMWEETGDDVQAEDIAQVLLNQRPITRVAPTEWLMNLKNALGEVLTTRLQELHKTNPIPMIAAWDTPKFRAFLTWFLVIIRFVIGSFDRIGSLTGEGSPLTRTHGIAWQNSPYTTTQGKQWQDRNQGQGNAQNGNVSKDFGGKRVGLCNNNNQL